MYPPHPICRHALALCIALFTPLAGFAERVPDFCFLQTSDNHLSPQPQGTRQPNLNEGTPGNLTWFCQEALKPQVITPLNVTTLPPAFVIDTGDVTEFGVINTTFDTFEAITKPLPFPVYITPGNHDNTWTSITAVMRKRHGGDHYAFTRFGCRFIGIDSSTPQEPLPCIERRTLVWLADELRRLPRDMPVFMFCHHPLSTSEFAKPFEELRLLDLIEDHNVVLLLMGHGHGHGHEKWNNLDSVMGGTTSHPHEAIGYNIVWVKDGILRVAFRPQDSSKPMQVTLQKPIDLPPGPQVQLLSPKPAGLNGQCARVAGDSLKVELRLKNPPAPPQAGAAQPWPTRVTARIDDEDDTNRTLESKRRSFEGTLSTANLLPGMHFLIATAEFDKQKFDTATEFLFAPADAPAATRAVLDAGVKAGPIVAGDSIIVATTGGEIRQMNFSGPRGDVTSKALFDAGVEILHSPVFVDGKLYFSAAEKGVHCLDLNGKLLWHCEVGAVVYGTPAVDAERVYAVDMEGNFHAIDRSNGKLIWSKHYGSFGFEMPVMLYKGVLFSGNWDGQVYAVNAADGSLKWKEPGPAGHMDKPALKSRYYAPADCPVMIAGDRLLVTDRSYRLGAYKLDSGEYLGQIDESIAAIGPTADGKGYYTRGLGKGLTRREADGKVVWADKDLAMGRFPDPPLEANGRVYSCSNRGVLTVHDAASGKRLLQYQACPQLHVMAPVAADDKGNAYVAGMDGSVTKIDTH